jgi:beta-lactamase superfamily II metal-dependent hydrolase
MVEEGYEIDFLPVGSGERSGDAIALRYGTPGAYRIMVVDGGDLAAGDALVDHINVHYDNPSRIDAVVCTHGDGDHSSGLRTVIDAFDDIGAIYMNRPWLYAAEIIDLFHDGRLTVASLERRLKDAYPILVEIEAKATARGIPIYEAFQGQQIGAFTVAAPSRARYLELLPQFRQTPEAAAIEESIGKSLLEEFWSLAQAAIDWVVEAWGSESLLEDPEPTSAENEASIVQIGFIRGERILLTGDAGPVALHEAADYVETCGWGVGNLRFMQVPHHGSRRNVTPSVLNRWLGNILPEGERRVISAYVSAAEKAEKHPRKKVVNAFIRRGAMVYVTKGVTKCFTQGMPNRGWGPAEALEFAREVES